MQSKKKGLIIFQKNLELGKVKTRLAKSVGDDEALKIYKLLLDHTHHQIQDLNAQILLYFSSFKEEDHYFDERYLSYIQSVGNLGDKMKSAFKDQFESGFEKLIIIGTDCPDINSKFIEDAFDKLEKSEVVIGPSEDGGYYLLGMSTFISEIFNDIPWSSEKVFSETTEFLTGKKIEFSLLPLLSDVDYIEDWEKAKSRVLPDQSKQL